MMRLEECPEDFFELPALTVDQEWENLLEDPNTLPGASHGEGFCLYSDIAIAIKFLKLNGKLDNKDKSLIIDLDAHQGNGLEQIFYQDESVYFFDMYNADIYPMDEDSKGRINFNVPLTSGTGGSEYLRTLKEQLPNAIKQTINEDEIKIAFYNAGTNVYEHDPLGRLKVSREELLER